MELGLAGKRALVTGSSIGIGAEIAHALAREGVTVMVHGRDEARTGKVVESITGKGGQAIAVLGDLTADAAIAALLRQVDDRIGGLDILVNNAGGSGDKHRWEETPLDAWIATFDRNVLATVRLTNAFLPRMRQAGWGRIVNVSSLAGVMPPATGPDYSAAKAAINNLTVSLSKTAACDGITVNSVSPGTIRSEKLEAAFRRMAQAHGVSGEAPWTDVEHAVLNSGTFAVPAGRVGDTADVANAVAFLCSPLAGYITGVNLRIDGGAMPAL